jgi:hypothetical protein
MVHSEAAQNGSRPVVHSPYNFFTNYKAFEKTRRKKQKMHLNKFAIKETIMHLEHYIHYIYIYIYIYMHRVRVEELK